MTPDPWSRTVLDLGKVVTARATSDALRTDVDALLDRAERLADRGYERSAKPLLAAATLGRDLLDGRATDRSAATVLARAAQLLHESGGNTYGAIGLAELRGDEFAAAYLKGAVGGADTTSAALLAPTVLGPVIEALQPRSLLLRRVVPMQLPVGTNAITLPAETTAPTGTWVAEEGAIPVHQGAFGAGVTLTVQKVGALTVATNELMGRSQFAPVLQRSILRACAAAVDAAAFAAADVTDAPGSLIAAGTSVSASGSAGAAAVAADLSALIEAAANAGVDLSGAEFVLHPTLLAKLQTAAFGTAALPFVGATSYAGIPFATTAGIPTDHIALVAWSHVQAITQGLPEIMVSNDAALHMNDAPNADVLAPTSGGMSLFQRDAAAIRLTFPMGWAVLHAGAVQYVDTPAWA